MKTLKSDIKRFDKKLEGMARQDERNGCRRNGKETEDQTINRSLHKVAF